MRPIDADELKAAFPYSGSVRTEFFRATIDHMPTIEPQRMRGRWVIVDGSVRCSECGNPNMEYDFCPYCGADMRGTE